MKRVCSQWGSEERNGRGVRWVRLWCCDVTIGSDRHSVDSVEEVNPP